MRLSNQNKASLENMNQNFNLRCCNSLKFTSNYVVYSCSVRVCKCAHFFSNDMFIISVVETSQLLENILSIYAAGTISITEHVL